MSNQPIVFSVPHSGTMFAVEFLNAIGLSPMYIHSDELGVRRFAALPEGTQIVVPIRHPYHVFLTHYQRNDGLRRSGAEAVMERVLDYYERLDKALRPRNWLALRVDSIPAKRQPLAIVISRAVGGNEEAAIEWAAQWPVVHWLSHEYKTPEVDWGRLDKWLSRFGYEPEDMAKFQQKIGGSEAQKQKMRPLNLNGLPKPEIKGSGTVIRAEDKRNGSNSIDGST